jgi:Protein of unknown function (DUF3040)
MSTQDKVTLSVRERQQLAHMQAALASADPQLAKLLAGRKRTAPVPARGLARPVRVALAVSARHLWLGPLALVAGFALILATFSWLTWLSIPGAVVAAAGLAATFVTVKDRLALSALRAASRPRPSGDV